MTATPDRDYQEVPTDDLRRAPSLVLVNTGHGKGKSTAAFGVVMRAVARDWRVGVVQFLKSGNWNTGEEKVCRRLGVDWWAMGEGFTWDSPDLTIDEAVSAGAWQHAKALIGGGEHTLVVLDEITYPVNWGWIDVDDVVTTINGRPEHVNVVCTGRDAPQALIDVADTVTEMRVIKHAYERHIRAKKASLWPKPKCLSMWRRRARRRVIHRIVADGVRWSRRYGASAAGERADRSNRPASRSLLGTVLATLTLRESSLIEGYRLSHR